VLYYKILGQKSVPANPSKKSATGSSSGQRQAVRLGREAEKQASLFLQQAGFEIFRHNVRLAGGELDLVAWEGPILAFVEVKAGKSRKVSESLEAVNPRKRQRLQDAAQAFVAREMINAVCRFDVVVVDMSGREPVCRLWRDAFRAGD
jgi:putative endonuclease